MELLRPSRPSTSAAFPLRAAARIVGRALVGLLVATGLVLGFGTAASAGGWAVTTLDEVPVPASGEAVTVGFTILQHGVTPANLDEGVAIEITGADGTVEVFPATNDRPGHYVASVVFPAAGEYRWAVQQGWFGEQELGSLSVGGPSSTTTGYRFPTVVRYGLPVLAIGLAGLAIADVLAGVRRRRTVMA
jgi:hypothetical protein